MTEYVLDSEKLAKSSSDDIRCHHSVLFYYIIRLTGLYHISNHLI